VKVDEISLFSDHRRLYGGLKQTRRSGEDLRTHHSHRPVQTLSHACPTLSGTNKQLCLQQIQPLSHLLRKKILTSAGSTLSTQLSTAPSGHVTSRVSDGHACIRFVLTNYSQKNFPGGPDVCLDFKDQ
jgi:hypothetical protein